MKNNFPININLHKFMRLINFLLRVIIFKLMNMFTKMNEKENEIIIPRATYAPWKINKDFLNIYKIIKQNTLCDVLRIYYIYENCLKLKHLKGDVIEIGCWRGGVSLLLCKIFYNSIVFVCDTFQGVVKVTKIDKKYSPGMHSDTNVNKVNDFFTRNKIRNFKILNGIFPNDFSDKLNKKKFKFAHIDTDTYQSTLDSINYIWPRMIKNGLVIIDDYGVFDNHGIRKVIEKDLLKFNDCFTIRLLSGQALLIKL